VGKVASQALNNSGLLPRRLELTHQKSRCMVNVGKILSSGIEVTEVVSKKLMSIKRVCQDNSQQVLCALNAVTSVSVFAQLGSHLAGVISDCSSTHGWGPGSDMAGCSSGVLKVIGKLHQITAAGMLISAKCHIEQPQGMKLYTESDTVATTSSNSMALLLAFILPVAMVMSFFGGARFAKTRGRPAATQDSFTNLQSFGRRPMFSDEVIEALPLSEESLGLDFQRSSLATGSPSARRVNPRFDI